MKRVWLGTTLLFLGVVVMAAGCKQQATSSAVSKTPGQSFTAALTGDQQVPAVKTTATGTATFTTNQDNSEMTFKLEVKGLKDITGAHIHLGDKGQSGPVVVVLFGTTKEGEFSGTLAKGAIKATDLTGDLKGQTVADLVKDMQDGKLYVNVHTKTNSDGEIRGQIAPGNPM